MEFYNKLKKLKQWNVEEIFFLLKDILIMEWKKISWIIDTNKGESLK